MNSQYNNNFNSGDSFSSYDTIHSYGSSSSPSPSSNGMNGATLRRRNANSNSSYSNQINSYSSNYDSKYGSKGELKRKVVKNLDLFPKVESDLLIVKTEKGGMISLMFGLILLIFILNEIVVHVRETNTYSEKFIVDTSLSKKMQVNLNMTFPQIACQDLHLDIMDVAGDSQLDIIDNNDEGLGIKKKRLFGSTGKHMSFQEEQAEVNAADKSDAKKRDVLTKELPENYCGPCYGAGSNEKPGGDCCNTCDEVIQAYKNKRWGTTHLLTTAEQCIREGRSQPQIKNVKLGEGCNIYGSVKINRVAGNFHFALGDGVERNGRHIHLFMPEDTDKFNTSHIIHELSFGPEIKMKKKTEEKNEGLNGVQKIVTWENGGTGTFQYFIKVVPTIIQGTGKETNRYFFTERFRPLNKEIIASEHHNLAKDEDSQRIGAQAGGSLKDSHAQKEQHNHQNAILPGVFFMYEIYPFAIQMEQNGVPFSHLLIRLMSLIGGFITVFSWIDSAICGKEKRQGGGAGSYNGGGFMPY